LCVIFSISRRGRIYTSSAEFIDVYAKYRNLHYE
jgi:hypothetical protein